MELVTPPPKNPTSLGSDHPIRPTCNAPSGDNPHDQIPRLGVFSLVTMVQKAFTPKKRSFLVPNKQTQILLKTSWWFQHV